jgi:ribosomal protein S18 acetylase RimI-like enzyme
MRLNHINETAESLGVRIEQFTTDDYDTDYDPWVAADEADQVMRDSRINVGRNKELTLIALVGDRVVGAVYSSFSLDTEYKPDDVWVYDFDVAVAKQYRGHSKIGLRLIDAALTNYRNLTADLPPDSKAYIKLYVVNPKLIRFLERSRGFEIEAEHSHGSAHMVRY